jgi:predicted PurR-regulated permease PerM
MERQYLSASLFFALAALIFYFTYILLAPFFIPLAWAAVLSILFRPLYRRLLTKIQRPGLTSLTICLLIIVLIVGPITYVGMALVEEVADAVTRVNDMYATGELQRLLHVKLPWLEAVKQNLSSYFDVSKVDVNELAKDVIDKIGRLVVGKTTAVLTNVTQGVLYFLMMLFATYYLVKDGHHVVAKLRKLIPLPVEQTDTAFHRLRDVIYATMYSGVLIALLQGALGGLLFYIFGVPSALFWGAIMAFLSILPFLGPFIVYIPAGLILILGGSYFKGGAIILIGTVVVSSVDNVLRPYLMAGKTSMHPLILFFAIAGGVAVFGLLGIVVGPLVAAAFQTLLEVLEQRIGPDNSPSAGLS